MTTGRRVFVCLTALTLCVATALAEVSIDNVVAKQRYPWNGLVDIACTVSGIDETTESQKFAVAAVMPNTGDVRSVSHVRVVRNGTTNSTDLAVSINGDYASSRIFLPAAGRGDGTSLDYAGSSGDYWSSVPYSDGSRSWYLVVKSGNHGVYSNYYYGRYYGQSVRPVLGFAE